MSAGGIVQLPGINSVLSRSLVLLVVGVTLMSAFSFAIAAAGATRFIPTSSKVATTFTTLRHDDRRRSEPMSVTQRLIFSQL